MEKTETILDIIKALKIARETEKLEVSDDMLFDCAVRIHNSQNITTHRQGNNPFKESDGTRSSFQPRTPATKKQIDTLYRLNANFDAETITKYEAMEILSRMLPVKKEKK